MLTINDIKDPEIKEAVEQYTDDLDLMIDYYHERIAHLKEIGKGFEPIQEYATLIFLQHYKQLLQEREKGYDITNKMITDLAIKEMEQDVQGDFGHKFANFLYRYRKIEHELGEGE